MIKVTDENIFEIDINPGEYIWIQYGDKKYKRKVKTSFGHIIILEDNKTIDLSEKSIWIPKRKIKSIDICMNNGGVYYDVVKVNDENVNGFIKREIYGLLNDYRYIDVVAEYDEHEESIIVTENVSSINIKYK